ncbi:MAG: Re/Si-specific NAD(P)(+) transhydrogenase subunit alpha [Longimicrobiales bacterium]
MKVAVLSESHPGEARVALTPDSLKPLLDRDIGVVVQSGAGEKASWTDAAYRDAGAEIGADAASTLAGADLVLRVRPPTAAEAAALTSGQTLIGFLAPLDHPDIVRTLADKGVTAFSMELVPRITRAQKMDALSSQATVAGYKAVLLGAGTLGKFLPMLMTAAGTIRPSKVLVLGAGVAGLQAIATAKRLGATVFAFDIRPAVKEQVESLGATFLEAELDEKVETEGGYARELTEEEMEDEMRLLARHIPDMDLVITTARVPGRPAPVLVTEEMVESMRAGSVIVDLASESGGNCPLSVEGGEVVHDGVHILGPVELAGSLPVHASQMYARNVSALLLDLLDDEGNLALDFEDEVVDGACVTHGGEIRNETIRELLGRRSHG